MAMALLSDLQKQHAGEKIPASNPVEQEKEEPKFRKTPRKKQPKRKLNLRTALRFLSFAFCSILFLLPFLAATIGYPFEGYELTFAAVGMAAILALILTANKQPVPRSEQNVDLANRLESLEDKAWEIRESEEIHRSLAEAFGDVVIHRYQDGSLSFSNNAFDEYFTKKSTLPPLQNNEGVALETRDLELETTNGKRWFAWTDMQVRDPQSGKTGWRSVARDITERKHHEQELIDARQNAETANEAKTSFLAMVSHEIRTPLNGVIGMAQLLEGTHLDATQRNYVDAIHSSGDTLLGLIENLLDTAQIEAGHMSLTPKPTHLVKLVEEVAELLSPRIREKQLSLSTYIDPQIPQKIMVDADRLRQVLMNLMGNSVKFTEEGGVSIHVRLQNPDKVKFTIEDTGPGISEGDQARIFDEFVQTDTSATRRHGGAGLGLTISQNIISLMGGKIVVESEIEKGSRFSFELTIQARLKEEEPVGNTENSLALILPQTPARKALADTVLGLGYSIQSYDSLDSFNSRTRSNDQETSIIIAHDAMATSVSNLSCLRENIGEGTQLLLIGNAGQQEDVTKLIGEGYNGWLTWPVRAKTLWKVLNGDNTNSVKQHRTSDQISNDQPTSKLNILLAEDNPINALLAKSLLIKLGHRVHHVEDGAAAVEATLLDSPYDIILMDLHMPVQGGLSAIAEIRQSEKSAGLLPCHIIVLSADGQASARDEALSAGANDFLTKPLDLVAVTANIENYAKKIKLQKS
ncbi:MAG: ATP-binding protein [Rhizobiaceae bacterium]